MKSVTLVLSMASSAIAAPTADGSSWSGWGNVKHFFAFGDSYTQTGFDVNGTQPTASNPLGNPPFPGNTWSNGPNWVGFLATKYNASNLLVYNFAVGGATVDSALVTPVDIPVIVTIKDQVQSRFLPAYGSHPASTPWTSASSLFAFFIGINDIDFSWQRGNATLYDSIFASYQKQLEDVYATGARNFLFQTIPAVNLSPLSQAQNRTQEERKKESDAIVGWNKRLTDMVAAFQDSHKGTTAFLHDTYGLYNKVLQDPKSYEQTAVYKDVTTSCAAYANLTNDSFAKDPSCKYAVNEYLWLDGLHTTFPIHDAAAASIAKLLSGETVAETVAETVEDDEGETFDETNEAGDEETAVQTDEGGDDAQDECDN